MGYCVLSEPEQLLFFGNSVQPVKAVSIHLQSNSTVQPLIVSPASQAGSSICQTFSTPEVHLLPLEVSQSMTSGSIKAGLGFCLSDTAVLLFSQGETCVSSLETLQRLYAFLATYIFTTSLYSCHSTRAKHKFFNCLKTLPGLYQPEVSRTLRLLPVLGAIQPLQVSQHSAAQSPGIYQAEVII
ncbi:uncharacterized protein EAE97_000848 [Botrytis byssoidea]|uniref:Uncharacterized protein n=1 Tax=Botrytis byssoidea TaxID=139641 RepID=A0A9P5IWJ4_9HELO|nr:uncharacterized protein EAE97_000848 [Botrytis byssoidea]KAF7953449.1 hypothetical protein EAE97_000848 [Botrytis byssoidea]